MPLDYWKGNVAEMEPPPGIKRKFFSDHRFTLEQHFCYLLDILVAAAGKIGDHKLIWRH